MTRLSTDSIAPARMTGTVMIRRPGLMLAELVTAVPLVVRQAAAAAVPRALPADRAPWVLLDLRAAPFSFHSRRPPLRPHLYLSSRRSLRIW